VGGLESDAVVTKRVKDLLEFLHATRDNDDPRRDLGRLIHDVNDMLDIASLDTIARNFHGDEPKDTPGRPEANELLENVDVCCLSTQMLVGLARYTFSKRALLPAWPKFVELAVAECRVRHPNKWESLMSGLYEKPVA